MSPLAGICDDVSEVLISEDALRARVAELGRQITEDYAGKPLLLVGVLRGATVFLADLIRSIDLPIECDFVSISSYGAATKSTGAVRLEKDLDQPVEGWHVLIVEDVVDTGWTLRLSYLCEGLLARKAASVKVCTLLDKPSRREVEVAIDYRGFEVDDRFVVGYGMDWAGRYRNLPYIGVLRAELCGEKADQ